MLFSSMLFLSVFLPLTFFSVKILPKKYSNIILLLASLFFYAWGEPVYVVLMIFSIFINYILGILINKVNAKFILGASIFINISMLGVFKYSDFILAEVLGLKSLGVALPIGISFYTFQALSYIIDLYKTKKQAGKCTAQTNIINLALYISFFPQLIAGPIVKYHDINKQLLDRQMNEAGLYYGIKRFIYGLSKKVLISNVLAITADKIFTNHSNGIFITPLIAWTGIICYTLQIYYDFSGYSDMAIGLGRMFGFRFLENFNYPYVSTSIREFWTRWHISLSTWFREYLYIPLGGNKKGRIRTYINLIIVFFATGIWHGASYNFIIWGLFHGFFIVIERMFLGKILNKNKIIGNLYTVLVVMFGWVFFRAENLQLAIDYIKRLFIAGGNATPFTSIQFLISNETILILIIGFLLAGPIQKYIKRLLGVGFIRICFKYEVIVLGILLMLCIIYLVKGTYNPFIYFRF